MSQVLVTPKVGHVETESTGELARARREALGLSKRRAAQATGVSRPTIDKVEDDDPTADELSVSRLMAAYARLENRDPEPVEIVNVIELEDGTRVTFTGSPDGVAEAAARFIAEHRGRE